MFSQAGLKPLIMCLSAREKSEALASSCLALNSSHEFGMIVNQKGTRNPFYIRIEDGD